MNARLPAQIAFDLGSILNATDRARRAAELALVMAEAFPNTYYTRDYRAYLLLVVADLFDHADAMERREVEADLESMTREFPSYRRAVLA